jgi:DNA-directed RNA polymerase specialized sigma24 family protein
MGCAILRGNMAKQPPEPEPGAPRIFATTHWSVVRAAGSEDSPPSRRALETLCQAYWYPIYAYVRRKGHNADDAQDLTQEFFAQLIGKERLRLADQQKGRFRTFLLAMLDYFLAREWNRAHRKKRGGEYQLISLDQENAEGRYRLEIAAATESPERHFQRQWALTVLRQTMASLETECAAQGKSALFGETKSLLAGERPAESYTLPAQRLGMSEGALRVAVHRLRQRYGEILRHEIAQTVDSPEEADEELRHLLRALAAE